MDECLNLFRGNDGKNHLVGRYMQVLYDGNLECKEVHLFLLRLWKKLLNQVMKP